MKFDHGLTAKAEKVSSADLNASRELNENDLNAVAGGTESEEEKKESRKKKRGPRVIDE